MMASIRRTVAVLLACTCVAVLVAATTSAASPTPVHLRGVRPGDVALYSGAQFECRDKSGVLPANQINDDYCDCADGSDEPGTSACAQSTFFCRNKGATALTLPASRVRDGVCDCCDGTDEMHADGTTPCANTCAEAGRAVREARAAELVSVEAGLTKRGELVTAAAEALAEKRAKLAKYDSLLVQRRALLEEARQVMAREEALEQEERNRRAEADRIRREAEAAAAAAAAPTEASTATDAVATEATQAADAPASAEQAATPQTPDAPAETATEQQEATKENFPYPQEYAFNPEEAAKQDAAEPAAEQPKENFPYPQEYAFNQEAADEAAASEEEQSAEAETIQPTYTDNVADTTADGAPKNLDNRKPTAVSRHVNQFFESVLPHIQSAKDAISVFVTALAPNDLSGTLLAVAETVGWNILDCVAWLEEKTLGTERVWETFGDRPIRPVSTTSSTSAPATTEAASSDGLYVHPGARDARANVDALSDKVTSLERKAADLRKVVDSSDYGAEYQFYHLDGQCYELKVKQYTYEVCPFSKAAQKEGHGSTSLGSWKGVERDEKTGRIVMKFSGGQTCWNGPQRSLTVALQCGATDELLAVEEPSKCVYEITMRTPAVCTAEQALELRRALEGEQEGENEHAHNKEDL